MGALNFKCTGVICCVAIHVATCHFLAVSESKSQKKVTATSIIKIFHEMKGISRDGGT